MNKYNIRDNIRGDIRGRYKGNKLGQKSIFKKVYKFIKLGLVRTIIKNKFYTIYNVGFNSFKAIIYF